MHEYQRTEAGQEQVGLAIETCQTNDVSYSSAQQLGSSAYMLIS